MVLNAAYRRTDPNQVPDVRATVAHRLHASAAPLREEVSMGFRKSKQEYGTGAGHRAPRGAASTRRRVDGRPRRPEALRLVRRLRPGGHHGLAGSMGMRPGRQWALAAGGSEFGGGVLTAAGPAPPARPDLDDGLDGRRGAQGALGQADLGHGRRRRAATHKYRHRPLIRSARGRRVASRANVALVRVPRAHALGFARSEGMCHGSPRPR